MIRVRRVATPDHQEKDQQQDDRGCDPVGLSRVVIGEVGDGRVRENVGW